MAEEKSEDIAGVDHISKLPEQILHHIMSFLVAKDAARIGTLSKNLYSAWSSLSFLDFTEDFFYRKADGELSENLPQLVKVLFQTLVKRRKQKLSIQEFRLTLPDWSSHIHNLNKILAACNIKKLSFVCHDDEYYAILDEEIFAAEELNVLHLSGFELEFPDGGLKFSSSLRELHLSDTLLNEQFIRALCDSCSGLQDLSLSECCGLAGLKIPGTLTKLRSVRLKDNDFISWVDIVAPNLEDISIEGSKGTIQEVKITTRKALKSLRLDFECRNIVLKVMKERKSVHITGVDHISKLPEAILQHIMSFLLAKDAARMGTLSKALNGAWSSLSYLDFSEDFLFPHCSALSKNKPQLVKVLFQTLSKRKKQNVSIQKFCLTLPSGNWSSHIHNLVKILVACNIKHLNFRIWTDDLHNSLPKEIFSAKELNVLHLYGFELKFPYGGLKFSSSLRELHLSNTFLDEQFIQDLCDSCSGLEDLSLSRCRGLACFKIPGTLTKLRSVLLNYNRSILQVDIVATNLEVLRIEGCWNAEQKVVTINACKALKSLHLEGEYVNDKLLEELHSNLPNLENLYLYHPALKTMNVGGAPVMVTLQNEEDNGATRMTDENAMFGSGKVLKLEGCCFDRGPLVCIEGL